MIRKPKTRPWYLTLVILLSALPLLLANLSIGAIVLALTCGHASEDGGNMTVCVGGASEEQMVVVAIAVAVVLLVIELGLLFRVTRRVRSNS
ncbi:hypothetical protein [Herbidospora sp. RD11066]